jgi:hypothetical protein
LVPLSHKCLCSLLEPSNSHVAQITFLHDCLISRILAISTPSEKACGPGNPTMKLGDQILLVLPPLMLRDVFLIAIPVPSEQEPALDLMGIYMDDLHR